MEGRKNTTRVATTVRRRSNGREPSPKRELEKKGFVFLEPCENPLETFVVLVRSESTVARPI